MQCWHGYHVNKDRDLLNSRAAKTMVRLAQAMQRANYGLSSLRAASDTLPAHLAGCLSLRRCAAYGVCRSSGTRRRMWSSTATWRPSRTTPHTRCLPHVQPPERHAAALRGDMRADPSERAAQGCDFVALKQSQQEFKDKQRGTMKELLDEMPVGSRSAAELLMRTPALRLHVGCGWDSWASLAVSVVRAPPWPGRRRST